MYQAGGKVFASTLTSGVTLQTTPVNLQSVWERVFLEVPTHTSGGTLYVLGGHTLTGTYSRIFHVDPADGGENVIQILQANGAMIPIPSGFQYYKVEYTSGVTQVTQLFNWHVS